MGNTGMIIWIDPTSGDVLPGLLDVVEDLMLDGKKKAEIVTFVSLSYKCSVGMVKKAFKEIEKRWEEQYTKTRRKRVAKNIARLERIIDKSMGKEEFRRAESAIMNESKLMGDLLPDITILLGGDKSPEALLKQADELRAMTLAVEVE